MLGCEAKVGLTSSSLPAEVIARLQSEDDLVTALTGTQQPPTSTQVPSETTPSTSDSIEVVLTEDVVISDSADVVNESTDDTSESTETATECALSKRLDKIVSGRGCAKRAMGVQAERMVKSSRVEVPHGQIGDNVIIPIPLVDRGRGDPRNILGVILDRDENDLYTISVKSGILTSKYSRNQFDICSQKLLSESDRDQTTTMTLRQAVIQHSNSGGQRMFKCNCAGSKRCRTMRCKCFKSKQLCNSRCHNSLTCSNK